jgi:hypothetical protein|tara:strand:+ start:144 stop:428 length:285 start_codon:yes stop_codon:yes gene_type:complete
LLTITLVRKRLRSGEYCEKCNDVHHQLEKSGYISHLTRIVDADEANPVSEGMLLAIEHNVTQAPFFIVEKEDGATEVYTSYLKLVRDVLQQIDQ